MLFATSLAASCSRLAPFQTAAPSGDVLDAARLLKGGKRDQAVAQFDAILKKKPSDSMAYRDIAALCLNLKNWDLALRYADQGLTQAASAPVAVRAELLTLRGMAYNQIPGQIDRAVQDHRAAFELMPNDLRMMNNLGYVMAEAAPEGANLDEPLRLTKRAVALARDQHLPDEQVGTYLDSLGWVQYKRGDYTVAQSNLARAAEMVPDQPEIHYHLAMVDLKLGRKDDAYTSLQRALNLDPTNEAVRTALKGVPAPSSSATSATSAPSSDDRR